jgi:PLD-like domain
MTHTLHSLPTGPLRILATKLRSGSLSSGLSRFGLQQVAGPDAVALETELRALQSEGMTPPQLGLLVQAIVDARDRQPDAGSLFDLVLSGPEVPGVPTSDTEAVMHRLALQASRELIMVGYAVHDGKRIFKPVAERMQQTPELQVTLCLDISRRHGDTTIASDIVARFMEEFRRRHWPWERTPRILHHPRSLAETTGEKASLHAKCVLVDGEVALVTSANFTEAAQRRNVEAGVLIRHKPTVARLTEYFRGLERTGVLAEVSRAW